MITTIEKGLSIWIIWLYVKVNKFMIIKSMLSKVLFAHFDALFYRFCAQNNREGKFNIDWKSIFVIVVFVQVISTLRHRAANNDIYCSETHQIKLLCC